MAAQVAPLEVDESVASLIVAHLPDIRDRLALACVSKVWRSAAGSPGCWGLYHDSLVVEVPEHLAEWARKKMTECMTIEVPGWPVQFTCEADVGQTWAEV